MRGASRATGKVVHPLRSNWNLARGERGPGTGKDDSTRKNKSYVYNLKSIFESSGNLSSSSRYVYHFLPGTE